MTIQEKLAKAIEQINSLSLGETDSIFIKVNNLNYEDVKQIAEEYSLHLYSPSTVIPHYWVSYRVNDNINKLIYLSTAEYTTQTIWNKSE